MGNPGGVPQTPPPILRGMIRERERERERERAEAGPSTPEPPLRPDQEKLSMQRVVITGIGLVTPNGIGTEATWRSVLAAESGIGPITLFDAKDFSTRFAGEVKGFEAEKWIPKKKIKEMGRFAQL